MSSQPPLLRAAHPITQNPTAWHQLPHPAGPGFLCSAVGAHRAAFQRAARGVLAGDGMVWINFKCHSQSWVNSAWGGLSWLSEILLSRWHLKGSQSYRDLVSYLKKQPCFQTPSTPAREEPDPKSTCREKGPNENVAV